MTNCDRDTHLLMLFIGQNLSAHADRVNVMNEMISAWIAKHNRIVGRALQLDERPIMFLLIWVHLSCSLLLSSLSSYNQTKNTSFTSAPLKRELAHIHHHDAEFSRTQQNLKVSVQVE